MAHSKRADKLMSRFGKNLEAARIRANYETASALANALNIKGQAYRKYERGESMPPPDVLVDIRNFLGVSLDWLIGNEMSPPGPPVIRATTDSDVSAKDDCIT